MLKEYNIRDFKTFEKKQKLNTKHLRNENIKLKLTFVWCIYDINRKLCLMWICWSGIQWVNWNLKEMWENMSNSIFWIYRPGREFIEHKIKAPAACLAVCEDLLAVGSWNTTVSLYSANTLGNYKSIGVMHGHGGTTLLFNALCIVGCAFKPIRIS